MEIQRLVGFGLILSGCCGLGIWYRNQFKLEIENLKTMCHILSLLAGQVRFGANILAVCCNEIAERVDEPFRGCLQSIYDRSCRNDGNDFGQVCKECFENGLKKLVVGNEEKALFIGCFVKSGFEEERQQLHYIEQVREELENYLHTHTQELSNKCKMALSLGTMSGILLVILFL